MKIGVCTIAWRDQLPIFEIIETAARIGFDGIEVWGRPPHTPRPYNQEYVDRVRKALSDHGLEVSMFGSYVRAGMENLKAEVKFALKMTKGLGTEICRIWAGDRGTDTADEGYWSLVMRDLREICKAGRREGVIFAMERHANTLTDEVDSALRLLNLVGEENLALNYQVMESHSTPEELKCEMRLLGEHIVNVHAFNFRRGEGERPIWVRLEEGVIDYKIICDSLKKRGFQGFVEVEFVRRGVEGELEPEEKELELMRDYEYLRRLTAT